MEQKPEQSAPAEEADAPDTKIVRFPAQAKRASRKKRGKPPKNPADFTGQTIRFTPIRRNRRSRRKAENLDLSGRAGPGACAAERSQRGEEGGNGVRSARKKRRRSGAGSWSVIRSSRQKRAERRREQPEREFSDCRAAYAYYAQGTFQRLRLFVSILLALVSIGLCYAASYPIGSWLTMANAESFSRMLLL
ncbi:MAG: hypothetical protein ACLUN5_15205 [Oscillospiraceae bacterium]